jgi:hypothetical protein
MMSDSALATEWAFTYDRPAWRTIDFNISALAGQSSVVVRFRFASDSAYNEDGVYIDNIAIHERRPSSPDFTVYGSAPGGQAGTSVAAIGSASGVSGQSDFAVGAPYADHGYDTAAGAAYVFLGAADLNGTTTTSNAAATAYGASSGSGTGWSVHGLTGFNNSNAVRIFVGAPLGGNNQGGALVGNVSAAIPEFSDLAAAPAVVALVFLGARWRRRDR